MKGSRARSGYYTTCRDGGQGTRGRGEDSAPGLLAGLLLPVDDLDAGPGHQLRFLDHLEYRPGEGGGIPGIRLGGQVPVDPAEKFKRAEGAVTTAGEGTGDPVVLLLEEGGGAAVIGVPSPAAGREEEGVTLVRLREGLDQAGDFPPETPGVDSRAEPGDIGGRDLFGLDLPGAFRFRAEDLADRGRNLPGVAVMIRLADDNHFHLSPPPGHFFAPVIFTETGDNPVKACAFAL